MKKITLFAVLLSLLLSTNAAAVELGSVLLGFHFNPAVEMQGGRRLWDLSMSFGVTIDVDQSNGLEFLVIMDSSPTSLGTSLSYHRIVTDPLVVGGGFTMLWAFDNNWKLIGPIIGSFAHVAARGNPSPSLRSEAGISFPLLTLSRSADDDWEMLPLVELPSLSLSVESDAIEQLAFQGRLTLQPVIVDTTQLKQPLGRINDALLVVPTFSTFLCVPLGLWE